MSESFSAIQSLPVSPASRVPFSTLMDISWARQMAQEIVSSLMSGK